MEMSDLIVVPGIVLLIFCWALVAEGLRRRSGPTGLWVAAVSLSILFGRRLWLPWQGYHFAPAPRVIALAACVITAIAVAIVPAFSLHRSSRSEQGGVLRRAGIAALVGAAALVVGIVLGGLVLNVLTRLGWFTLSWH